VVHLARHVIGAFFTREITYTYLVEKEGREMRWELNLDPKHKKTKITIEAQALTEDIQKLTTYIDQLANTIMVQNKDGQKEIKILNIVYIVIIERKIIIFLLDNLYDN